MRRSVAFWRVRPAVKVFSCAAAAAALEAVPERDFLAAWWGARRCDSARSRRSWRSCARRDGASSGRAFDDDDDEGRFDRAAAAAAAAELGSGGRED